MNDWRRATSPGRSPCEGDAADEPLQIIDPPEGVPEARADLVAFFQLGDSGEPSVDLLHVKERVQEPFAKLPACHGGDRVIEHRQQRAPPGTVVDVLHQFEISLARAIQDHVGLNKEGLTPRMFASAVFWVSSIYRSAAPAAETPRVMSPHPNPSSVAVFR